MPDIREDYLREIQNPIDLGMIRRRIISQFYRRADIFLRDFILLHENTCKYYGGYYVSMDQRLESITNMKNANDLALHARLALKNVFIITSDNFPRKVQL
jgi:hypothetical protein